MTAEDREWQRRWRPRLLALSTPQAAADRVVYRNRGFCLRRALGKAREGGKANGKMQVYKLMAVSMHCALYILLAHAMSCKDGRPYITKLMHN